MVVAVGENDYRYSYYLRVGFTGLSVLLGLDFKKDRDGPGQTTTQEGATQAYPSV